MPKKKSSQRAKGFWTSTAKTAKSNPTIRDAQALMMIGKLPEAKRLLESLARQSPHRVDIWQELAGISLEMQDYTDYELACEQLVELEPNNSDRLLNLLDAYIRNTRPILAMQTCHTLLANYPELNVADDIQRTLNELDAMAEKLLGEIGLFGDEGVEIAAMHERMQIKMQQGDFAATRQIAGTLLERKPDFLPGLNNLSMVLFQEGDFAAAIATAEQALAIDAHNVYALANMLRVLHILGRTEETTVFVERLLASDRINSNTVVKQAEIFSYLGRDRDVITVAQSAANHGITDPLLHHFAGAAALRLGDATQAKHHWQQAIKLAPYLEIAQSNLDDLSKPIGERHAPYAFRLTEWLPGRLLSHFVQLVQQPVDDKSVSCEDRPTWLAHQLAEHPELVRMAPILLERGDASSREFVIQLAKSTQSPELLELLREFTFSQWGADQARHSAAIVAQEAGLIKPGQIRMWLQGDWHDIYLMSFEITDKPKGNLAPKVQKLLERALLLLHQGKGEEAEKLLKQALEIAPDNPSLLNNLAIAYSQQERTEESEALLREIHQRFPDYLLGRTAVAKLHAYAQEYEQAEALIRPLFEVTEFHVVEYSALCDAQITILHAKGEIEGAKAWAKMWENVTPDHPTLEYWQLRLGML